MRTARFQSLDIQLDVEIAAPVERIWQSLTRDIGAWWPKQFYVGTHPRRFVLEPHVGGRVIEDWGDGEGSLFGIITVFEQNRTLQWAGDMSADYGGPARSVTTFRLRTASQPGLSVVAFRDTPFGLLGDDALKGLEQGWRWLLNEILKPYIEQGRLPERPMTLED